MVAKTLERTTFRTSRLLEFCSEKELVNQTGHETAEWPLVILKELVDNALDACEEAGAAPEVMVTVDGAGISVTDNGPGLPVETIEGVLDYAVRASSREAYVAPDRGAQGNALKTILPMPFVLGGGSPGLVAISTGGECHEIAFSVDPIRQEPVVRREVRESFVKNGTEIRVAWPDSACSILTDARQRFLQITEDYTFLNPHLTLTVEWFGESRTTAATDQRWRKWLPSDPTCPHWYEIEHFERLASAYLAHDIDRGADRLVREFIKEFRGLTGSAKQKAVLSEVDLARVRLSELAGSDGLRRDVLERLLSAMKKHTKPVQPAQLGIIGREHIAQRFEAEGCEMESFEYKKILGDDDGVPTVIEAAFAWKGSRPQGLATKDQRRIVTGVNWSPGLSNLFRSMGDVYGDGLLVLLQEKHIGWNEPVIFFLHAACPRVQYLDRGKTSIVLN